MTDLRPKRLRPVILVVALVAAFITSSAVPASAHAVLLETSPAGDEVVADAPGSITATFNESIELAFGALRVYDTEGTRVDVGDAEHPPGRLDSVRVGLEPDLPAGTYTATYRVISADAHPVDGAFVFHVGAPGERPQGIAASLLSGEGGSGPFEQVLFAVVRWAGFAGMLALGGGLAFALLIWGVGRPRPAGVDATFGRRWRRVMVGAWIVSVVAAAASIVLQGAVAADVPLGEALGPAVLGEVLGTRFGRVAILRLLLLAGLAAVWLPTRAVVVARREPAGSTVGAAALRSDRRPWAGIAAAVLGVGLLATPALSGHAAATDPVWLNVPADVLHLAAGATWVGGLLVLVACAWPAARAQADDAARVSVLALVVARFSTVAGASIAVLVATGIARSWIEIGALRALFAAPYGWVLVSKVGVFAPMLALGALNRYWTKPNLLRARDGDRPPGAVVRTLRRVLAAELALGILVVGITSVLVNLPPARIEAGVDGPFITDVRLGDDNLNVVVDPNRVGENEVHLIATTPEGTPADLESMHVLFDMPEQRIGPLRGEGTSLGPGHFVVQGRHLSVEGGWVLTVVGRYDEFTEARTEVRLTVN